ncbi:conserved hypothetical protein [Beggiatoa sp. PS]|nr:conserved hypothetical protein [Beggiatoa sp. PS]
MNQEKSEIFQPEIKVRKIILENFRGFEQLELEFQSDLTVLIGENGAGKTTILDGLAKLLLIFEKKIRSKPVNLRGVFDVLDIKYDALELVNTLSLSVKDNKFHWETAVTKTSYQKPQTSNYDSLNRFRDEINLELRNKKTGQSSISHLLFCSQCASKPG